MKVWKPVGAVAVYSRARVTLLVLAFVLLVGGLGFLGGIAAGDGDDDGNAGDPAAANPAPASQDAPDDEADEKPAERPRAAYRRGYRAGRRASANGVPGVNGLESGEAYFVRIEKGPDGLRIGRREPVVLGTTYWLCAGGQRLCMREGP